METPEVSVICAVYNGGEFLEESLRSILTQDETFFELIVIDDGSDDGSGTLLDSLADEDARLRVVHRENQGLTRSLIEGCSMARAPYLARHDADDLSFPGRLAAQKRFLDENPAVGFVSCGVRFIGPRGERLREEVREQNPKAATQALVQDYQGIPHGSVMMRRGRYDEVGGYRDEFFYGQDADLWLRLTEVSLFGCVQDMLYAHRLLPDSISSGFAQDLQASFGRSGREAHRMRQAGKSDESVITQARKLSDRIRSGEALRDGTRRPRNMRLADGYYFIGCLLRHRDPAAARRYFLQVIRHRPLWIKGWLQYARCWLSRGGEA